jgi:hypothetical protein
VNAFAPALDVANAVLYEGYILYPYTASARKNRIRWQFGVIVPQAYAAKGTGEPAEAQTEIFLECEDPAAVVEVLVRFLQVESRQVEEWTGAAYAPVERLAFDGRSHLTFDEGLEREISASVVPAMAPRLAVPIAFGADEKLETLRDASDRVRGRIVRRQWPLHGVVTVECEPVADFGNAFKLRVRIENVSAVVPGERSSALRTAFVSSHTLLHARGGRFLSALDPPQAGHARPALVNRHTWPVLVGDAAADAQRSALVLSSPIILYDFPAVAPQSEGDTFDALEIDELMMLSVLSLTDEEREEARATDPRARAIVERAERFGADELAQLHGSLTPALDVPAMDCVFVDGVKISKGSNVRLHPKRRADVWDMFLDAKIATVRAIHQDVEGLMYVAVTVDDDPASDLHEWYGRSFFFYPDEVEPVEAGRLA